MLGIKEGFTRKWKIEMSQSMNSKSSCKQKVVKFFHEERKPYLQTYKNKASHRTWEKVSGLQFQFQVKGMTDKV